MRKNNNREVKEQETLLRMNRFIRKGVREKEQKGRSYSKLQFR